jgi:predicted phosphodiesterase
MRVAVLADAHANLTALSTALGEIDRRGVDLIIHAGDAVGMGPFPAECLDLLISRQIMCVLGNHDEWLAFGLPTPQPAWMSDDERVHQEWTHAQVSTHARGIVRSWPYEFRTDMEGVDLHSPGSTRAWA